MKATGACPAAAREFSRQMSFPDKALPGLIPNFLCPPWGPNPTRWEPLCEEQGRVPEWEQPCGGRWEVPGMPGSAFRSQGSSDLPKGNMPGRGVCFLPRFPVSSPLLVTNEKGWDLPYACRRGKNNPAPCHPLGKQKSVCALLVTSNFTKNSLCVFDSPVFSN